MKKLAFLAVLFLVLTSIFVVQHEWLHQDVAEAYGCDASSVQGPTLEDLSDKGISFIPAAFVTWSCEDSETQEQVKGLQLIVEIVGYQVMIVFLIVAFWACYQLNEFANLSQSLNRIERNQELLFQEMGVQQVDVQGENQR